jgi:hypothetical protein
MADITKLTDEQLNIWIHENVFGGCWHEFTGTDLYRHCRNCDLSTNIFMNIPTNPDYCNDISDAWKVVENWVKQKHDFAIIYTDFPNGGIWTVEFDTGKIDRTSLCRAICEAAKELFKKKPKQ